MMTERDKEELSLLREMVERQRETITSLTRAADLAGLPRTVE